MVSAKHLYLLVIIILYPIVSISQIENDELIGILKEEINREMDVLSKQENPVYYIDYRVVESNNIVIGSSFGSLVSSTISTSRMLSSNVRIGSYSLDNTHDLSGSNQGYYASGGEYGTASQLPLEKGEDAIKQALWRATSQSYKTANAQYEAVLNYRRHNQEIPKSADFSKEPVVEYYEAPLSDFKSRINTDQLENSVKGYSSLFLNNKHIINAEVTLAINVERKYFVSSEGSTIAQNMTYCFIWISASALADDGDVVPVYRSYFAYDPKDLPDSEVIKSDIHAMINKLDELRVAPLAEPYTGPAILSERSAGVFFHEIFGHRVEGHRLKSENDGQTFREKIGEKILPKSINITFNPSLRNMNGIDLVGAYQYDDEGIKGDQVDVVTSGELKTFLFDRTPFDGFHKSNGHGRASAGMKVVSRQSNLLVETSKSYGNDNLRKMLIAECKKQDKPYGYLFQDVTGGYTFTDRYQPNVFNIMPIEVYRIYVDGRPDELVRGVDLIGTPLSMFAEIKATGDKTGVFNGICGAESGNVPVSASSPSLFVRRIETQKKPTFNEEPPLLTKPVSEGNL